MPSTVEALNSLLRYSLISDTPVGRGGCGIVWHGHDLLLDRSVAIKTISDALSLSASEKAHRTFVREAIAGARLSERSRHIVTVTDLGAAAEHTYFVMEWIEPHGPKGEIHIGYKCGASLLSEARGILFDICEGASIAHDAGIAHCDIAPWNIVYDPRHNCNKLSDFGLLRILESIVISRGSGSLLQGGRQAFMPAEAWMRAEFSAATDVYALAITLGALLEGQPFLQRVRSRDLASVIRITKEARDAPPQVCALIRRFVDGHKSTDTVREFLDMLQQIPG